MAPFFMDGVQSDDLAFKVMTSMTFFFSTMKATKNIFCLNWYK